MGHGDWQAAARSQRPERGFAGCWCFTGWQIPCNKWLCPDLLGYGYGQPGSCLWWSCAVDCLHTGQQVLASQHGPCWWSGLGSFDMEGGAKPYWSYAGCQYCSALGGWSLGINGELGRYRPAVGYATQHWSSAAIAGTHG